MEVTEKEKNKQQEFLSLYQPHHDRFVRYCMALCGSDFVAKDLVNETLLKSFEGFETIRKKESFLYYLFSTAKRIWSNQQRRNKFWSEGKKETLENYHHTTGNDAEVNVDVNLLYRAMEELPEEQREALVLFEILGFSINEIREIQNAGLSAVKARLTRGREKLGLLMSDPERNKDA